VNIGIFAHVKNEIDAYRLARDYIGAEDTPLIEAQPLENDDDEIG
jgi:hypothetical protein